MREEIQRYVERIVLVGCAFLEELSVMHLYPQESSLCGR